MYITEKQIIKNWCTEEIIVSVCILTFNHEKFISEALDSVLQQKTNFGFEILIHDDASVDNTKNVILDYQKNYPHIIKPILQNTNQRSIYGSGMNPRFNYPRAIGTYIALCDGDDFWIDELKLQKQIDYLRNNRGCVMCFHSVNVLDIINNRNYLSKPNDLNTLNIQSVIISGGSFAETSSIVFKSLVIKEIPEWFFKSPTGDFATLLLLGLNGEFGYIDQTMSTYRKHPAGVWSGAKIKFRFRHLMKMISFLIQFDKNTQKKYRGIIFKRISILIIFFLKFILKQIFQLSKLSREIH